jgi:thiol-disulfide isomerase/thioredoxin
MAGGKNQPQPGFQLNPTTMAMMGMTLLVGIIIGVIIGRGTGENTTATTTKPGTEKVTRGDTNLPTKATPRDRSRPTAKPSKDSPFMDSVATAKFEADETALSDYRRVVDFVDRRNARAAGPILDRLKSGNPDAAYQEEVGLLSVANQVNQNLPQQAMDGLADWRHQYPESRLMAQAALVEGKAHMAKARGLAKKGETPTGEAKLAYEKARDTFMEVPKQYGDNEAACGEALFSLGSVHNALGNAEQSLATFDELVTKYPQHPMAASALYSVASTAWSEEDTETATKYFQQLVDDYPNHSRAKRARKNIEALGIIGNDAPELALSHWIGGTGPGIADSKGKVIVLAFWNEWCPHCRRELPHLQQWNEKYGSQGLVIIPVTKHTKSQTDDKVEKFMVDNDITLPCAVESAGYASSKAYGVSGVPAGVVIGRDGKVAWRNHPARLTDERLEAILAR